jgi:hypothetical protein
VCAADFRREANQDGGITITDYKGQSKTGVIPGSIDGKPVTAIGDGALGEFF